MSNILLSNGNGNTTKMLLVLKTVLPLLEVKSAAVTKRVMPQLLLLMLPSLLKEIRNPRRKLKRKRKRVMIKRSPRKTRLPKRLSIRLRRLLLPRRMLGIRKEVWILSMNSLILPAIFLLKDATPTVPLLNKQSTTISPTEGLGNES